MKWLTYISREQRISAECSSLAIVIRMQDYYHIFDLSGQQNFLPMFRSWTHRHHHSKGPYYDYESVRDDNAVIALRWHVMMVLT
jgi:hypothetical protein